MQGRLNGFDHNAIRITTWAQKGVVVVMENGQEVVHEGSLRNGGSVANYLDAFV